MSYLLPPVEIDHAGHPRCAGFELELGNLSVVDAAGALQADLGGELKVISPFEAVIDDTPLGKLKIERDAEILRSGRYRSWLSSLGVDFQPGSIGNEIESRFDSASSQLVPCEVVTRPIPFNKLALLDTLVGSLSRLGAQGTQDSLVYAFGLHINPSLPDQRSDTLRRIMQSFLLLQAWIIEESKIDLTRRFLTNFIDPYPVDYMLLLLRRDYQPELPTLVEDYLHFNPTRNRALDMLPIFSQLAPDQVSAALSKDEQALVQARPAFHYRLPDCKINQSGWQVANAWNQWVYIERLAMSANLLDELIDAWQANYSEFSIVPNASWTNRLTSLITEKYLRGL